MTGLGEDAGAALTRHPGINFVSFTGSPEVGRLVQEAAASHTEPHQLPATLIAEDRLVKKALAKVPASYQPK